MVSITIQKMQIKTIMRYSLIPVRMAFIRKNKCWQSHGEKGNLVHCWWECKLIQPPWKTVLSIHQKTKNMTTIQTSKAAPRYLSEENKHKFRKVYPYIHCSIIYNIQDTEATEVTIDRWMDNMNMYTHTHTHSGILLSHKKWNFANETTWMDIEGIMWNESDKDKCYVISLICEI